MTTCRDPQGLQGSVAGVVVGGVVAVYGALGVAQAVQNAMNVAWSVPRHRRPNPLRARLRSLLLLGTAGIAVLGTTVLSILGASVAASGGALTDPLRLLVTAMVVPLDAAIFVVVFRVATATALRVRDVLPGAIVAAVVWQLLQLFGTAYVARIVQGASATYGVFALVLGLLAWIFLAAWSVVMSAEINVVLAKHLYPRALLTPFTDDVDLTGADRRSYTDAAVAQQHKGFQSVDVTFDHDGQNASARRRAPAGTPQGDPTAEQRRRWRARRGRP